MLIFLAGLFLGITAINLKRASRTIDFKLQDNCLLTKYPLVFIPGRSSLFYFLKYWNNIPFYLKEHGYDVIIAKPHFLSFWQRNKSINKEILRLSKAHKKMHLIFDLSQINTARSIEHQNYECIKSIHIFSAQKMLNIDKNNMELHLITDELLKFPKNKEEYLKIAHDSLTQSPAFVPSSLLGSQSLGKQLTVEPHYLKKIIKIAETDWV